MQRIRTKHWLCGSECVADAPDGYPLAEGLAVTCEPCADTWWHYPIKGELVSQFDVRPAPSTPAAAVPQPLPRPAVPPPPPRPVAPAAPALPRTVSGRPGMSGADAVRAASQPPPVMRTGSVHDVASGSPKELVVAPTMRREDPAPELRKRSERGADVYSPAVLRSADDSSVLQRYAVSAMALLALAAVVVWYVTSA